jgi:hypothetical protein
MARWTGGWPGLVLHRYLAPCLGAAVAAATVIGPPAVWGLRTSWC